MTGNDMDLLKPVETEAKTASDVRQDEQLPQVLREIADHAPETIEFSASGFLVVTLDGQRDAVGHLNRLTGGIGMWHWGGQAAVQAALQALCEARGWGWALELHPRRPERPHRYSAWVAVWGGGSHLGQANTPALALALAVRAALQGVGQ